LLQHLMIIASPVHFKCLVTGKKQELLQTCAEGYLVASRYPVLRVAVNMDQMEGYERISRILVNFTARVVDEFPDLSMQVVDEWSLWSDMRQMISEHRITHLPVPQANREKLTRIINLYIVYPLCQRIGCHRTRAESSQHMRACSGCRFTFYCSRRCQKQAWAYDYPGHRDICSALRTICGRLSLNYSANDNRYQKQTRKSSRSGSSAALLNNAHLLRLVLQGLHTIISRDSDTHALNFRAKDEECAS
jgi:hypothetical protein